MTHPSDALSRQALVALAPACLLLDTALKPRFTSPAAQVLLGGPPPTDRPITQALCGQATDRPVADALAQGRPVRAEVHRPIGETLHALRVETQRLGDGWLLTLRDLGPVPGHEDRFGIVTRDPVMRRLIADLERVAKRGSTVLLRGETGTGKELLARALHAASERAAGPFRAINCAALPAQLLESELFGHVRGAFTGAHQDVPGHLRLAQGGTLFLDEVAEMPLPLQAKLLRVLTEREVIPVGGRAPVPIDVRFVSATHQSLRSAVDEGRFRADLMYRLRVVPLHLPPLRERPADVLALAEHFIARENARDDGARSLGPCAEAALLNYPWPGNVRELENAMERAFALGQGTVIQALDLPPEVGGQAADARINAPAVATAPSPELARIQQALERHGGHRGRAAASLGMSRSTLWRRLRALSRRPS